MCNLANKLTRPGRAVAVQEPVSYRRWPSDWNGAGFSIRISWRNIEYWENHCRPSFRMGEKIVKRYDIDSLPCKVKSNLWTTVNDPKKCHGTTCHSNCEGIPEKEEVAVTCSTTIFSRCTMCMYKYALYGLESMGSTEIIKHPHGSMAWLGKGPLHCAFMAYGSLHSVPDLYSKPTWQNMTSLATNNQKTHRHPKMWWAWM